MVSSLELEWRDGKIRIDIGQNGWSRLYIIRDETSYIGSGRFQGTTERND